MKISHILFSAVFSALLIASVSVRADELPAPMDSAALAASSGAGESVAQVNSDISNNSIGNVGYTGGIGNIGASGNSGLTTMIENTGNQVSISTATVVNVMYH